MPYHDLPQPGEISIREKEDAMGAYLMMFAAFAIGLPLPVINLIAAIIYYYINRKKSRFIHFHALQSLLSQIPTTLINWGLVIWAVTIFFSKSSFSNEFWAYAIFAGLCTLVYVIMSFIAAFRAREGKMYYFLFFGKIAYSVAFQKKAEIKTPEIYNKPPL